jgi:hypothetical protein
MAAQSFECNIALIGLCVECLAVGGMFRGRSSGDTRESVRVAGMGTSILAEGFGAGGVFAGQAASTSRHHP